MHNYIKFCVAIILSDRRTIKLLARACGWFALINFSEITHKRYTLPYDYFFLGGSYKMDGVPTTGVFCIIKGERLCYAYTVLRASGDQSS